LHVLFGLAGFGQRFLTPMIQIPIPMNF
jgi:hypothetical protein